LYGRGIPRRCPGGGSVRGSFPLVSTLQLRYTGNNIVGKLLCDSYLSAKREKGVISVNMSIEVAHRIVEACKQRAAELRSPVSIAIVDAGGHLVLFERMMAPYGWATSNISIAKASTAVMFNQPTDAVAQWGSQIPGFAASMATMTQGKFVMAAGGWPIRMGNVTVGGIGISGGNAPGRDDEIARAGLAAVEAMAPPVPIREAPVPPQARSPMQPTAGYPSLPQTPSLAAQDHVPASTRHLAPEQQDYTYGDELSSSHESNVSENTGGAS
jgi:uncharacterized protein GlcG (DUF336 family)